MPKEGKQITRKIYIAGQCILFAAILGYYRTCQQLGRKFDA
jgi:hypothetical protein